ncbi:hypothetical protein ACFPPD_11335 [Cohnella suwonensis]|uniref:Copper amine oxidase-like N-terminal domain-containing protein n=1 Tax=Cohnella suwonensis TaxID=696072 RepID=A0ABW0LVL7_9BACL
MKKVLLFIVCLFLAAVGTVSAHAGHETKHVSVLVNGVTVDSGANHISSGKLFISLHSFARVFEKDVRVAKDNRTAVFNGKTLKEIRMYKGEPTAPIRDLAAAVGAQQVSWDAKTQEAYVLALPGGTIKLTPVVPMMGEHWANLQDMPIGPIYGVYKGKLVFIEYMVAQDDFIKGVSHPNLGGMKGLPSPSVIQTDIEFQEHGHEGFEIPHYDIHAYFITDEEQQLIK